MPLRYGQARPLPLEGQPVLTSGAGSAQVAEVAQQPPRHPGPISSDLGRTPRSRSVGHSRQTQPASRSRPMMAGVPTPMSSASTSMRSAVRPQPCSSRRSKTPQTRRHHQGHRQQEQPTGVISSMGMPQIHQVQATSRATCMAQVFRRQGRKRHRRQGMWAQRWPRHQVQQGRFHRARVRG